MAKITLQPTIKQDQAYENLKNKDIVFFGGGAGGGKSWFVCESRLINCYLYPGYRSFIGREELKRLMQSTYITWTKVCQHHNIPKSDWRLNGQYNYIEFFNESRIDLLDLKFNPSDPLFERFGSLEYTDGAIEEAGEVHPLAYDVLKTRIGRHKNKEFGLKPTMLITGNPKKNWTYQEFYKPFRENRLSDNIAFIQALYRDNPYTAEEYKKQLGQISDKVMRQRLEFGNWEYEDDNTCLMDYDSIIDLFSNTIEENDQKFFISDIARFGGDRIVYTFWKGYRIYKIIIKTKQGLDKTEQDISEFLKQEKIPRSHCLVDEDGVGGGVVDHLKGIKGFVANSSPVDKKISNKFKENYRNLKTQCAYMLAEKVCAHEVAIDCDDIIIKNQIIEELEQIRRKEPDKEGKLQIIPKEEVKEILGRSPDIGDCCVMRMYFKLLNKGEALYNREDRLFYEKMQAFKQKKHNVNIDLSTTTIH